MWYIYLPPSFKWLINVKSRGAHINPGVPTFVLQIVES